MSEAPETVAALSPTPETGLTDAEAEARREQGLGNAGPSSTTRTYWAIVRENVFTFINNLLFLMGALLVVVGRPFDAFVSERYQLFDELPEGARLGFSHLRQRAQLGSASRRQPRVVEIRHRQRGTPSVRSNRSSRV